MSPEIDGYSPLRKLSQRYLPFHDRDLDSFADDIITRPCGERNVVLDCGYLTYVSDPDFAPYGWGETLSDAARNGARAIRANARGTDGKRPRSCLDGYDLHYRLMPHWARKELMQALGIDMRAAHMRSHKAFSDWEFKGGEWLSRVEIARHFEFFFILLCEDRGKHVKAGTIDLEAATQNILGELEDECANLTRASMTDTIRERVRERTADLVAP